MNPQQIASYLRGEAGTFSERKSARIAANLIEKQQQRIEELERALIDDATAKIMLEKLSAENGVLDVKLRGNIFHVFCEAFVKTFKESCAKDYLTAEFHSPELGDFTVTMQRSQGMTVYQKLSAAEQKNNQLAATVERLRVFVSRKLKRNTSKLLAYKEASADSHNFHGGWSKGYHEGIVSVCEEVLDSLKGEFNE